MAVVMIKNDDKAYLAALKRPVSGRWRAREADVSKHSFEPIKTRVDVTTLSQESVSEAASPSSTAKSVPVHFLLPLFGMNPLQAFQLEKALKTLSNQMPFSLRIFG